MSRTLMDQISSAKMVTTATVQSGPNSRVVSTVSREAVLRVRTRTTRAGIFVSQRTSLFECTVLLTFQLKDNLRFAFNSCIFGTTNATDTISTPCSTSSACGPIQKALGDGMGTPLTTGQYSYCTAYDNSFLGSSLDVCRDCLKLNNDASYLSNCTFCPILRLQWLLTLL